MPFTIIFGAIKGMFLNNLKTINPKIIIGIIAAVLIGAFIFYINHMNNKIHDLIVANQKMSVQLNDVINTNKTLNEQITKLNTSKEVSNVISKKLSNNKKEITNKNNNIKSDLVVKEQEIQNTPDTENIEEMISSVRIDSIMKAYEIAKESSLE